MESYNNYDKFCKEINDKENNNKECKTIMKNSKSLASKKKSLLSKNSIPEEMIKSKMSEVSPTGSSNKKVFFVESFLVEHEEEKQLSENNTLAKQPSLKCRKILNIQTFNIFSNISQSKRFIVTSDEKGFEISPKASLSRSKFDGNKTQNLKTSIEETEWPNEKAMNQKLEEKAEVILNSLNNKESASFLEFDKAKIYKFYFSHNNIDRILIAINSKIIDKNNKKRYNSHFIKTSCRKRKVLHLT